MTRITSNFVDSEIWQNEFPMIPLVNWCCPNDHRKTTAAYVSAQLLYSAAKFVNPILLVSINRLFN